MDNLSYTLEVFDDGKIGSSPRLQFVWRAPNEKQVSIWSIDIDGGDLRRVTGTDIEISGITHSPVRSPDNRFIITSIFSSNGLWMRLIDLKLRTSKNIAQNIAKGESVPHFNWLPDSRHLIFYLNDVLVKYNITANEFIQIPHINSQGLYYIPSVDRFIAIEPTGFSIFSVSGKKIETVALGIDIHYYHCVSADGKLLMYAVAPETFIIETDSPNEPVYTDKVERSHAAFSPDNRHLFYNKSGNIYRLTLKTKQIKKIWSSGNGAAARFLTLYNLPKH